MRVRVTVFCHGIPGEPYLVEAESLESAADGLGECCVENVATGEFLRY